MIQVNLLPFNIDLLILKPEDLRGMRPIEVLDITSPSSRNFHPGGLFSTEIFGKFGEEKRNRLFSYIPLHTDILHPVIYKAIIDLKELYLGILSGKTYAIFNSETKDFEAADIGTGETGYNFFMNHYKEMLFEERPSAKREFNIKLIDKYRDKSTLNELLVLPAGLRDYVIDENGKPTEDEINTLYRKVISLASIAQNINSKINLAYIDSTRFNLQIAIYDIYLYIKSMLEGKNKLILGKWASRKIFHSTRNVITSYIPETTELFGDKSVSTTQTVVGLYQYLRSILPLAVHDLRDGFLSEVFVGPNSPAIVVNKKTLTKEMVTIPSEFYDQWMTYEGLEKVLASYGQENLRHNYVEVGDYYLGLIFLGKDGTYKLIHDKNEVPDYYSDGEVRPITFTELLYLSCYKGSDEIPCLVTRYPITGYGSIYPSYSYLKTTVLSEVRRELGDDWKPNGYKAQEFPKLGRQFFNSLSPNVTKVKNMGADFDGDKCSYVSLISSDAKLEIKKTLHSSNHYLDLNGGMAFSASTDVVNLVVANMTS